MQYWQCTFTTLLAEWFFLFVLCTQSTKPKIYLAESFFFNFENESFIYALWNIMNWLLLLVEREALIKVLCLCRCLKNWINHDLINLNRGIWPLCWVLMICSTSSQRRLTNEVDYVIIMETSIYFPFSSRLLYFCSFRFINSTNIQP